MTMVESTTECMRGHAEVTRIPRRHEMTIAAKTDDGSHSVEENGVGVKLEYKVTRTRSIWLAVIGVQVLVVTGTVKLRML